MFLKIDFNMVYKVCGYIHIFLHGFINDLFRSNADVKFELYIIEYWNVQITYPSDCIYIYIYILL